MHHSSQVHSTQTMANSKSKLLATQNPFSLFLMIFIFFLLLITSVKSDSFSFNFPSFEPGLRSVIVDGDATLSGGVIQLTQKDQAGNPIENSVGLAGFFGAFHLFDKSRGKVADFTTEFSFVVNPKGSTLHGDGLTFFLASLDFDFPDNSSGGFLGLFNKETAFNASKNQVVAVEFDSFANEWDPNYPRSNSPHIGIDINSITSVATAPWFINSQPEGAIAKASISYSSYYKQLSASVTYPKSPVNGDSSVSHPIDFTTALSEWVLIGFTGTTSDLVETHDILSWSFTSNL